MEFLTRVAKRKEKNKMTANNLGICIVSSLFRLTENSNESSTPTSSYTAAGLATELMINHFDQLFPKEFSGTSIDPIDLISPIRTSTVREIDIEVNDEMILCLFSEVILLNRVKIFFNCRSRLNRKKIFRFSFVFIENETNTNEIVLMIEELRRNLVKHELLLNRRS